MSAAAVAQAVRELARARRAGAHVLIAARPAALDALVAAGRPRAELTAAIERAFARLRGRAPAGAAAAQVGWASFDLALAGERAEVVGAARGLLAALRADPALAGVAWQVAVVRIADDPEQTLSCDVGAELADAPAGDVLAWIEPYGGDDWRWAGRLPQVTFEPPLVLAK